MKQAGSCEKRAFFMRNRNYHEFCCTDRWHAAVTLMETRWMTLARAPVLQRAGVLDENRNFYDQKNHVLTQIRWFE